jgi:putative phosphoesterase
MRIGLISDTHGLLRPEALAALQGVEHIIHAGDFGDGSSPAWQDRAVTAIRGNNDSGPWANGIPETARLELEGVRLLVIHDLAELDSFADCDVVISGHSHRPEFYTEEGILYVNPGSAGPRRFKLPISVGFLDIADGVRTPSLYELPVKR